MKDINKAIRMGNQNYFTTSEFAKKFGLSKRTLQYYDKIDLLKPAHYSDTGHRQYSEADIPKLQKILTLKFIGFSLNEIKKFKENPFEKSSFLDSLKKQKEMLIEKNQHISHIIKTITSAENFLLKSNKPDWVSFENIIHALNEEKLWLKQYKNPTNLKSRISLHEKYSTNKKDRWDKWCMKKIQLSEGMNILDVGCGIGNLWKRNLSKIPPNTTINLADYSAEVINECQTNLTNTKPFKFRVCNIQELPFANNTFDLVIANHMLYHTLNINVALKEVKRVLKPNGRLVATTIGESHLKEIKNLTTKIDPYLTERLWSFSKRFSLENGEQVLSKYFRDIKLYKHEDSLCITDSEPIINYISSMEIIKESLANKDIVKIKKYIQKNLNKDNVFFVKKDLGLFVALL